MHTDILVLKVVANIENTKAKFLEEEYINLSKRELELL